MSVRSFSISRCTAGTDTLAVAACEALSAGAAVSAALGCAAGRDVAAQRRMVADAFAGSGWEFPRLVDAMWQAEDFYCDLTCQIRMPSICGSSCGEPAPPPLLAACTNSGPISSFSSSA